jgi:aminoglycoside phosphotransferase family enzyme/predicted kinase
MTSRYVYKVKKPVNLGFLDFSTLKKRHHFCEREVLLNWRLSSHVHLGVLPIFQRGRQLAFDDGERVVEYVIQMRRLDDRYFFPMLLKRNEVGRSELNRVVARLKKFYEAQSPSAEITRWGRLEKLKISTNENFRQTEPFVGKTISRPAFKAIHYYTTKFYQGNAGLFAERMRQRRIRDCHGDLRLEHIHLGPKGLAIYDCIEFNDRLRYLDWANDLAFLAMDLDYNGRPDLSRYFTRRMSAALRDEGLLKVVDFYKCYRAYVRGKVESFQSLGMPEAGLKERREMNAQRYFRLALQYAICGSEPIVLVFMGRIASGKSTLARSLGRELAWDVFSSDFLRKTLAGVPSTKRVIETRRKRKLYGRTMTNKTYTALLEKALAHLRKGSSVILDATFGDRRYRDRLRSRLSAAGAKFLFVEVQASDRIVKGRLKARDGSAGEMSDARLEDFQALSDAYEPPSELPTREVLTARTGTASVDVTTAKILKALAARAALRCTTAQGHP